MAPYLNRTLKDFSCKCWMHEGVHAKRKGMPKMSPSILRHIMPKCWTARTQQAKMSCPKRSPSILRHLYAHFEKDSYRFLKSHETQCSRVGCHMVFMPKGLVSKGSCIQKEYFCSKSLSMPRLRHPRVFLPRDFYMWKRNPCTKGCWHPW